MLFLSYLDLNLNEIRNAVVQNLASAPSNPVSGLMYYNTTTNSFNVYSNGSWVSVSDIPTLEQVRTKDNILAGDINFNNVGKIINLVNGTNPQDAITKSQLDSAISGLSWKQPVDEIATTPSGNESGNDGWRVLINGVGTGNFVGYNNNIAIWNDTLSTWSFIAPVANYAVLVKTNDTGYTYDLETTTWIQFTGAGQITAGAGLDKLNNTIFITDENKGVQVNADGLQTSGSEIAGNGLAQNGTSDWKIDVKLESDGGIVLDGVNNGLEIKPDVTTGATVVPITVGLNGVGVIVDNSTILHTTGTLSVANYTPISSTIVSRKYIGTFIGTGVSQTAQITHNLNNKDISVTIRDTVTDDLVMGSYIATTVNRVDITGVAVSGRTYNVIVIG